MISCSEYSVTAEVYVRNIYKDELKFYAPKTYVYIAENGRFRIERNYLIHVIRKHVLKTRPDLCHDYDMDIFVTRID